MDHHTQQEQSIINTFIRLVNTMGYEKVNIKLLTGEAGVNRTTFYEYFSSKSELAEYICYSYLDLHNELLVRSVTRSSRADVRAGFMRAFDYTKQNADTIRALWAIREPSFSPYLIMQNGMRDAILKTLNVTTAERGAAEFFAAGFAAAAMATTRLFLDDDCQGQDDIVDMITQCCFDGMFSVLER